MSEWKEYKLIELVVKIIDNRGKTCPVQETGFPLIATNCIRNEKLYPDFINVRYVSDETYDNWFRAHPEPDDLIFVLKGTPGRVCWTPNPVNFCIAQDMVGLRANRNIVHPKYLFAVLRSQIVQQRIEALHVGSLIPHFKKGDFDKLYIPVIEDINLQQYIGDLYYDFCYKIELNNKINQELENLAQTLFKHWFIDFEFPNEKGEPYKSSGGALVDSELGEIPKGWEVKPIGDLFEFVIGGDWGKDDIDDEHSEMNYVIRGTDILTLKSGSKNGVPYRAIKPSKLKNRQLEVNDIIIEISGGSKGQPTGRTVLITKEILERLDYNAIPASFCRLIRPKNDFAEFLGIYLTKIYDEGKTWEYQNQSTGISNFQFKFFESSEILALPSDLRIIDEFNSLISGFYNLMTTNENQELTNLRDTLLPKLISGELEVAEVMAEKA